MARKQAVKIEPQSERVVSFRAPDRVHGALKQIVGRLEMMQNVSAGWRSVSRMKSVKRENPGG